MCALQSIKTASSLLVVTKRRGKKSKALLPTITVRISQKQKRVLNERNNKQEPRGYYGRIFNIKARMVNMYQVVCFLLITIYVLN